MRLGFTTIVAKLVEPIEPGPPGPMALHPLRRMRCELFQMKRLQEHTYSFFRVELSRLLGGERNSAMAERKSPWRDSNQQPFD